MARRHSLSNDAFARLRAFLLSDSYAFAQIVCGHRDLVPELHMPLSYMVCGLTDKLIATLEDKEFDSYVTRKLRRELWQRQIDWTTPEGKAELNDLLDFLNIRWFRGSFKSSMVTHSGTLFMATGDPNITLKITHATDEKAWEFCSQIGDTMNSGIYRDFFPDRIPEGDESKLINQKRITLGGRTISHPQTTIQASGYLTKDIGGHYDRFIIDDLVTERNATPELLKAVHSWLRGLTGYEMTTRQVRRIHVGTKWAEDDDDAFLTRGPLATSCLTVRVPIEEYEGEISNILERGTPTIPQLFPKEKIAKLQARVLSDEAERDGAMSWRCNYLLDAYAGGARLFPPSIVDDCERRWMGPYEHHKKELADRGRYLVARTKRDAEGSAVVDEEGRPKLLFYDWAQLDRVCAIDPAWADGGDNWAVSAIGRDSEGVAFQLSTLSDNTGLEGWIEALCELDSTYHFRIIGFDGGAYQDAVIQNLLKTDKRLRRLRSRTVKVPHKNTAKKSRIRGGVAEPLRMHKLLLDPTADGQATRDEMKAYKGDPNAVDGILDSLSMAPALYRRVKSEEEKEAIKDRVERERMRQKRRTDPALGVCIAA